MSRIDPAEFDRLARRRQEARKTLSDAEVKQREATVGVKMAEAEVLKADVEFNDYVSQHAPLPPHQPSLTAQPKIDFPRLTNIHPINASEQTATEVLRRRVAHGYPPPG